MRRYALDPTLPVLLRPDGTVQVGWDPRRAVLVQPPEGLTATALATVLRALQVPMRPVDLRRLAAGHGLVDESGLDELLDALVARGVLHDRASARPARALSIRVHGCGPLSDLLVEPLRRSGARIAQTSHTNAAVSAGSADMVVFTDYLVADPRLVRDLHTVGIPHLPVRVRDGAGLVGPLVIPGVTSCLACADLHRTDRDAAWPAVAAQLREVIGSADRPTVLATAAVALGQLQRIITAVRGTEAAGAPPATLNTTLEVDVTTNTISARRWSRHPRCGC
ncbi:TOMM precursor leader peptide-binding protein [Mycolicibacterium sp. CH28]|uniref:TOMM precursor leader peptide-binding protein n=1 Tax=Mycolicibacterium sp. CH28 TaxID=2512237 RepID=UPI00108180FF|nr:TOMM precursor leader peptide-binding protein [Mycolicibacterium sp. CH28]TGD84196.1 TOMM precursor leader peptide-binding protein [Mycolicibacterium sp. CH28]